MTSLSLVQEEEVHVAKQLKLVSGSQTSSSSGIMGPAPGEASTASVGSGMLPQHLPPPQPPEAFPRHL
jgi:hypothetical protein